MRKHGVRRIQRHGFTLLEMTFILIILGVAVSSAAPPLMRWQKNAEIASSIDRFERTHELARVTSIRTGRVSELHIDEVNQRFWVEVDTSGAGVTDTVSMAFELPEQISFESDRSLLCFDARGLPTTAGACETPDAEIVFTVQPGDQVDTTRITLLGKILR